MLLDPKDQGGQGMNREQRRQNDRAARLQLPKQALPSSQEILIAIARQNQHIEQLLTALLGVAEAGVRYTMGQTEGDIDYALGLKFPVPTQEEKDSVDAVRAEAESKAAEDRRLMDEAAEDALAAERAAEKAAEEAGEL